MYRFFQSAPKPSALRRVLVGLAAVAVVAATLSADEPRGPVTNSPDEPRRPSAEEVNEIADALERALDESNLAEKRRAAGILDVGDAEFAGFKMKRTDEEWQRLLSPDQFRVARQRFAEPAADIFQIPEEAGVYRCTCGQALFSIDAATGDSSALAHFHAPIDPAAVVTDVASAWSGENGQAEMLCGMCGAHLGHVDPGADADAPLLFKAKPTALVFDAGSAEK